MKCCCSCIFLSKYSPLQWLTSRLFPDYDPNSSSSDAPSEKIMAILEEPVKPVIIERNDEPEDHFQRLPIEMKCEILKYLPLSAIYSLRCVSSQWKALTSRRFTDFTCGHLTDESYAIMKNASEVIRTIKIYDLTKKDRKVLSSTRGAGGVIADAQSLQIIGNNLEAQELRKVLHYGVSATEILFQEVPVPILNAILAVPAKSYLGNLTQVAIQFKRGTGQIEKQIRFLNKLASLAEQELRVISHLNLKWSGMMAGAGVETFVNHFLATMRLIVALRKSLKSLELTRSPELVLTLGLDLINFVPDDDQRVQANLYRQQFQELHLDCLNLTTFVAERHHDRTFFLENALLESQSSLKNLCLEKIVKTTRVGQTTMESILPPISPPFPNLLQALEVSWTVEGNEPINLAYFTRCPTLKSLTIYCYCFMITAHDVERTCKVVGLEQLPTCLETLKLIRDRSRHNERILHLAQSYILLTQAQIDWVTTNLRNLKYFGCLLLVQGQFPGNASVRNSLAGLVQFLNGPPPAAPPNFETLQNMDPPLFNKLLRMNQIRKLELNMVCIQEIMGFGVLLDDHFSYVTGTRGIAEYLNICRGEHTIKELHTKVNPLQYVEVTITK